MELWIRSQDRELLTKVEGVYYDYQQEIHHITVFTNEDYHWVGIYKTKERALEVLDEIQDLMRSLCDSNLKIIQYEMPKE